MAGSGRTRAPAPDKRANGAERSNGDGGLDADQAARLLQALEAARDGDFSVRLPKRATGAMAELAAAYNELAERNQQLAAELTRVGNVVGREGRMDERASLGEVGGSWQSGVGAVNGLIDDLVRPTTEVARVIDAVAEGDLGQKMALKIEGKSLKGEFLRIGNTVNAMVDQLSAFADEVTRVAREVGTEGKLGGQAAVPSVAGTWKDLTENVNLMADNLTEQVRNISQVTTAVAEGDLSQKITVEAKGEVAALADTINTMVDQLSAFADEVTRVAREVGTEGKLGGQAEVAGVSGTWRDLTENVNLMADNLTDQVRNIAGVTTAVAEGDLSQKITVEAKGEVATLADTINTMVDQLNAFADEVTRVAREVGTEGKLGGQAEVAGVSGTWRDLTQNVNSMASNLTDQVRNIAGVTTAVANGDLSQKITVSARGEILELKDTINTMVDQLSSFADEVTRVAREVGTEGKLGGQAQVEDVSGTWRRLTENVNQLAGNLTTQVRAIAEVSTAVTQGDLTRSITVEAEGEVADLKGNINQMIANLRDTTLRNEEQDWVKTKLAAISGLMQGERDLERVTQLVMSELTPAVSAQHGAFFLFDGEEDPELRLIAGYGHQRGDGKDRIAFGEGLVGQAAVEQKPILVENVPGDYVKVSSGLGEAAAVNVMVLPVLFEDQTLGVIELGSLHNFSETSRQLLDPLMDSIGVSLSTIVANRRTEELLEQSQTLTQELQSQSEELRQTNDELQEKAGLLSRQNRDIEVKNREIELARAGLEEKAEQLALSSRYKSEFLANMSHELRTPLNSLLILSDLLARNEDGHLTDEQVEFARTIHSSGSDLLELINDILDLSKVEAGRMDLDPRRIELADVRDWFEPTFRPVAEQKGLELRIEIDPDAPEAITTDEQRVQQVLRNLLSNAFKFTREGSVTLSVEPVRDPGRLSSESLRTTTGAVALSVSDTGIGIAEDKLKLIFEAFQQADGTTSRRYGGTGLGLSISREIAHLLGGEIHAESKTGEGSRFTLYLPPTHALLPVGNAVARAAVDEASVSVPQMPPPPELVPASDEPDASDVDLAGRKVLIVDDDVRNVFALTSVFEPRGATVLYAEDGQTAIDALEREPGLDLVLMDIMMPGKDGYETIRTIRSDSRFEGLPILALTAKAMKGDREKSIASGASDHVTKPVELDRLLSLMRTWLEL